ncbi:hypothetical protein Sjap_010040 [Stephania japonica]|uniref:Uncharacterized protein n=1 Tax=Stephania japonica TaxID=461633 RepID=A0AAP0J8U9_9MAGN
MGLLDRPLDDRNQTLLLLNVTSLGMQDGLGRTMAPQTASFLSLQHKLLGGLWEQTSFFPEGTVV